MVMSGSLFLCDQEQDGLYSLESGSDHFHTKVNWKSSPELSGKKKKVFSLERKYLAWKGRRKNCLLIDNMILYV
jgi:hypothetical protein